jgi:hypothetical protein
VAYAEPVGKPRKEWYGSNVDDSTTAAGWYLGTVIMTLWSDGVGAAHFGAGLVGCEHPFDAGAGSVSLLLPSGDFADEVFGVVDSAIQTLTAEHADLDLDHVEPAGMLFRASAGANAS